MADGKVSIAYSTFLGYDKGPDGNLVVNKEQAKIVRLIYRSFMEGMAPIGICRMLEERGIPSPGGKKKWYEGTIISIQKESAHKDYGSAGVEFPGEEPRTMDVCELVKVRGPVLPTDSVIPGPN